MYNFTAIIITSLDARRLILLVEGELLRNYVAVVCAGEVLNYREVCSYIHEIFFFFCTLRLALRVRLVILCGLYRVCI